MKSIIKKCVVLTKYDIRYWTKRVICFLFASRSGRLKKLISQADIVSFDIFDTLIKRKHNNPRKVFKLVSQSCKGEIDYPYKRDFTYDRICAEKQARKKHPGREITIEEIYAELEWISEDEKYLLMECEKKVEMEEAYASKRAEELFEFAKGKNKLVIITSDMYMPLSFIKRILRMEGYAGYENIFLSSDIGSTKSNGGLYFAILDKYPDKKIVHIGDSVNADLVGARKHRVFSVLFYA